LAGNPKPPKSIGGRVGVPTLRPPPERHVPF
jgi:hypothetical protein